MSELELEWYRGAVGAYQVGTSSHDNVYLWPGYCIGTVLFITDGLAEMDDGTLFQVSDGKIVRAINGIDPNNLAVPYVYQVRKLSFIGNEYQFKGFSSPL